MFFHYSIRLRLAAALFAGSVLLLGIASVSVYFVVRGMLKDDFDARLFAKAQAAIMSISQKGASLDVDWADLPQELNPHRRSKDAIQLIDSEKRPYFENSPLGTSLVAASAQGSYQDATLAPLGDVRVLTLSFVPRVEEEDIGATSPDSRKPCILAIASKRAPLEHSLHKLAGILVLMTGATSLLGLVLVWMVVKTGLRPLDRLGEAVGKVEAGSLGQGIPLNGLPAELVPIVIKLNDLLDRLNVSFVRERRFSADVSHELRTPVAELRTLSEVMLQETTLPPEVRQAFEDARQIAGQMEALVVVLLEMVRPEKDRTPLVLMDVDLQEHLLAAWCRSEAKAASRGIALKVVPPEKKIMLRTEPRLLERVLAHLFDNAVEYSPDGGAIDVEFMAGKESSCLLVSNATADLAPSDLPHMFERFWRKDKVRGESGHFGLGLALTQTLCQRLGVYLSVSMDKSNYVRFRIDFPAQESTQ